MNEQQEQVLSAFASALDELDAVMASISDDQLDWSDGEGQWSIRQVLHHLADDGNVYTFIIERALATPGCKVFFGGFPGNEAWAKRLGFDQRPVTNAYALLQAQRHFILELVSRYPDRWDNQVGYYNEAGEKLTEQTIQGMIIMLTEHMQEHTAQITHILAAH